MGELCSGFHAGACLSLYDKQPDCCCDYYHSYFSSFIDGKLCNCKTEVEVIRRCIYIVLDGNDAFPAGSSVALICTSEGNTGYILGLNYSLYSI